MQAIMFLLGKAYSHKLKRAFSSVLSSVITILGVGGIGLTIFMAFRTQRPLMQGTNVEMILAGIVLMIGLLLYNTFLSRDTGILTMADATYLFTGPFERRTVLAYILISTAPGAALTGFFMSFYLPYLLGPALTFSRFLIILLIISLLFGCIYLSYYYIYIVDTEKTGFKKKAKYVFFAFAGLLVLAFVIMMLANGLSVKSAGEMFFTHWWYNYVPLFGWTKWAISSLLSGNLLSGFLPATSLLVFANVAFSIALYNVKADFYEKALEDSVNLQKMLEDVKANGSADARSVAKLKNKASSVRYYEGAAAIFSRQMLENKKVSITANMREIFLGVIYVVVGKVFGLEFSFVFVMLSFGALSMSMGDAWHRDFKKPYVYLIPASSFQKVIFSVLPGLLKNIISGGITITIGALAFKIHPSLILSYVIIYASFSILFIFAEVFTYRIIGIGANAVAVTFMRMLFVIATCIPALIVLLVIMVLYGTPDLLLLALSLFGVNLLSSALLAFLSKGIFEKSELMS
ncbi:hypothetical protein CLHUN_16430 [Ruminiclostridium hungatei]|uniref:ABC exporter n=1 Tax=Ruminiclostridium hungatei TaxID=48256 RepID=A0A1V4SKK0_RUMHU|nr:putative ABC exporter domain-containing protein [Ruminiclostridium hungatei]OPX44344.1 hypothetical protein CLHUN_16430 [Ruminiclostridium hungatei]